jgi:recombination protein RecA
MDKEQKDREIKKLFAELQKQSGTSVVNFGQPVKIDVQPTGSISLDTAIGIGGIPLGRIIELYGPESGGKTSISLMLAAETQKAGGRVFFFDAENALDLNWAEKAFGVNPDPLEFGILQENCAEVVFDSLEKVLDKGLHQLVIVDSVSALSPRREIEGTMEQKTMGLQAAVISQALRKLVSKVKRSGITVIFINQLREKIGIMFGNPETTPGGRALKFYSSVRMRVSKSGKEILDDSKNKLGHEIVVRIKKNKVGPPYREANLTLLYSSGIDKVGDIFEAALAKQIIVQNGSSYKFADKNWRGKESVKAEIKVNPALAEQLKDAIRQAPQNVVLPDSVEEEEEEEPSDE